MNILITGCSDIRHVLKTTCDAIHAKVNNQITFYIHEKQLELLARNLLELSIIHETHLNVRERVELYFDVFGNAINK